MKKILSFLFSILFITTSCSSLSQSDNHKEYRSLSVTIFQTLNKNEALALTPNYDVVKIVSYDDIFYDGKKIRGYFVLIDTYSYENMQNVIKTVPVYMNKKEYSKLKK